MTTIVDKSYFNELLKADPNEVCRRTGASYDAPSHCYKLTVFSQSVTVSPQQKTVQWRGMISSLHPYLDLFVVHYLLVEENAAKHGRWISEKDLPGGSTFFRGPHQLPTAQLASHFDGIDQFKKRCEVLGGAEIRLADSAFVFEVTPRITIALLYWQGDEDFLAESKILFDAGLANLMQLDVVFALAVAICTLVAGPDGNNEIKA